MDQLGLTRLAPRTERALDAELTPAEQATLRSSGKQIEFGQLVVDLINHRAFGPLCGDADSVRLAEASDRQGFDIEMLAGDKVVGSCKAESHWELLAQQLASAPHDDNPPSDPTSARAKALKVATKLKESGLSHAVSHTTDLAVGIAPIGTAVGIGTRLVRSRIRIGHEEADAFERLGLVLRTMRAEAQGELSRVRATH